MANTAAMHVVVSHDKVMLFVSLVTRPRRSYTHAVEPLTSVMDVLRPMPFVLASYVYDVFTCVPHPAPEDGLAVGRFRAS